MTADNHAMISADLGGAMLLTNHNIIMDDPS
jgi:hypothetical protein